MYNHQKKPSKNPQLGKRDMAPKVGGSPKKNFFLKILSYDSYFGQQKYYF